jgi:hypothetical protein
MQREAVEARLATLIELGECVLAAVFHLAVKLFVAHLHFSDHSVLISGGGKFPRRSISLTSNLSPPKPFGRSGSRAGVRFRGANEDKLAGA